MRKARELTIRVLLLDIVLLLVGGQVTAQEPPIVAEERPSVPGSLRMVPFPMTCISAYSGEPIDCEMWFEISFNPPSDPSAALGFTGGHLHPLPNGNDPSRPIGVICSPKDQSQGECPPTKIDAEIPHAFHLITAYTFWTMIKTMPQFSGLIDVSSRYRLRTPGYFCIPDQFWSCDSDRRGGFTTYRFSVAIRGLVELPPDAAYIRCGLTASCFATDNESPSHPRAFYGTQSMVMAVQSWATTYNFITNGWRLRLTDMSLPTGGLFDIADNWKPKHDWHREGIDIDISRQALQPNGQLVSLELQQDRLDDLACKFSLNRYERKKTWDATKFHYRNEACPQPAPGR